MRALVLAGFLVASTCWAQQPVTNPQQPPFPSQAQAPSQANPETITVPVETRIPLTLASPITGKMHPGDAVRATVAFPVTVGTTVAIPAGAYVEGTLAKINKRGRPSVQIHFTTIVFANGYTVPINGANTEARLVSPPPDSAATSAFASGTPLNYAPAAAQSTGLTPPPSPSQPSHLGAIVGFVVASVAAVVVTILLIHHHGAGNGVLFDTGWQFDMVLQTPLIVNAASAALPSAQ